MSDVTTSPVLHDKLSPPGNGLVSTYRGISLWPASYGAPSKDRGHQKHFLPQVYASNYSTDKTPTWYDKFKIEPTVWLWFLGKIG